MSVASTSEDEFSALRASFGRPLPRVIQNPAPRFDAASLRARLAPMGVPYEVDESSLAEFACGNVRLVLLCKAAAAQAPALAELAFQTARWHGDAQPFCLVLACAPAPKTLVRDRPLTMRDINSGATWSHERLIVLWRWDADAHKVLIHELTHLCAREEDEARTEERALRIWCAWAARDRRHYAQLRARLAARLLELQAQVRACDPGTTNAEHYWVEAPCLLDGGEACRPPPRSRKTRLARKTLEFVVVPPLDAT